MNCRLNRHLAVQPFDCVLGTDDVDVPECGNFRRAYSRRRGTRTGCRGVSRIAGETLSESIQSV